MCLPFPCNRNPPRFPPTPAPHLPSPHLQISLPSIWLDIQPIKDQSSRSPGEHELLSNQPSIFLEASINVCWLTHMVRLPYPCPPRAANISWKGNWRCRSFSITSSHLGSPGARSSSCSGTAAIISGSGGNDDTLHTESLTSPHTLDTPQTCPDSVPGVPCY